MKGVDGNSPVGIDGSFESEAEDILWVDERGRGLKRPKQGLVFADGLLEAEVRDFSGGGVYLVVVVALEFLIEHFAGLFDVGDILAGAGSDEVVLEPAVRAFDLTFGLGG